MSIKKLQPYLLAMGVVLPLFLQANVYSDTGHQLDNNQEVIAEIPETHELSEDAKRVGATDYFVVPMGTARKLKEEGVAKKLHPIQSYKPVLTANDPVEPQAYLTLLDAEDLWDASTGNGSTVVAVLDTGFALSHEDLVGRWYENTAESGAAASNGLDDDGNGFIDDWRGWDFANNDNDPSAGAVDPGGAAVNHGTAVTGMIGATGNNNLGVASLNWGVKFMPVQVLSDDGIATTAELALALDYAINNGADVINLSLGSTGTDGVINSLIDDAESMGIPIVAAAGNCGAGDYAAQGCDYQGQLLFPANNPKTIAVGATDLSDERASFSSWGSYMDVAAPGSGAISTTLYDAADPNGAYSGSIYGTSFAAPVVSGLTALLRDAWPAGDAHDLQAALKDSALKTTEMSGQFFTQQVGFGRIRPLAAVERAQACAAVTYSSDINCDSNVDIADLSLLASQWELLHSGRSDVNKSGQTDIADLSVLASQWGQL